MTTTPAQQPTFDPNVCIGYLTAEHPFPEAQLRPSYLCPTCDDRLNGRVDADRAAAQRRTQPTTCPGGDHAPGSHWSTCLACYGD